MFSQTQLYLSLCFLPIGYSFTEREFSRSTSLHSIFHSKLQREKREKLTCYVFSKTRFCFTGRNAMITQQFFVNRCNKHDTENVFPCLKTIPSFKYVSCLLKFSNNRYLLCYTTISILHDTRQIARTNSKHEHLGEKLKYCLMKFEANWLLLGSFFDFVHPTRINTLKDLKNLKKEKKQNIQSDFLMSVTKSIF